MIEIPKKEPLNIVPFIDIMLVLLAMVLSISTFIAKGEIAVELPKSPSSSTASTDSNARMIQVDGAGDIFLEGQKADAAALERFIVETPREERIVLRIDKNARFEHFIGIVDLFKKHQHENFTIATEKADAAG